MPESNASALDPAMLFEDGYPEEHSKELAKTFTRYRINVYRQHHDWKGNLLLEYFKKYFQRFTQPMLLELGLDLRRHLRGHLVSKGIYCPLGDKVSIPKALFDLISKSLSESQAEATTVSGSNIPTNDTTKADGTGTPNIIISTGIQNEGSHPRGSGSSASTLPIHGLISLMKAYSNSRDKYSGAMSDNMDSKLRVFNQICKLSGVLISEKPQALSLMLESTALDYYFSDLESSGLSFYAMVKKIRNRFMTQERELNLTREWDSTNLLSYIQADPTKSGNESLECMISRLKDLQLCVPAPYKSEVILKNKLLTACEELEECRLARQKVSPTVEGVIADLHTSISSMSKFQKPIDSTSSTALLTERRRFNYTKRNNFRSGKSCFVCGKQGCWSSEHSPAERIAAIKKKKRVRAFFLEKLRDLEDDEDEDADAVEAAITGLEDTDAFVLDLSSATNERASTETIKDETRNETGFHASSALSAELFDISVLHVLSKSTEPIIPRRYNQSEFFGVAIDTCCNYNSTGGRDQYLAYCSFLWITSNLETSRTKGVRFGMGSTEALGTAKVYNVRSHLLHR